MVLFKSLAKQKCPETGQMVDVNRPEAQCRREHECGDMACPLAQRFAAEPIDMQLMRLRLSR